MCPFLSVFLAASTSCTECPSAENITNSLRLVVSGMRHSVAQKKKKKKHFLWGTVTLGKLQGFLLSWFSKKQKHFKYFCNLTDTRPLLLYCLSTWKLWKESVYTLFILKNIPSKNVSTRSGAQSGRLHNANKAKVLSGCLFLFFFILSWLSCKLNPQDAQTW